MAFKISEKRTVCPDDPESLFRDLRKKTVPGLLSHQADLLRSYLAVHTKHSDIALQLPTGSGKTLVGLLIAEWRRLKYGERVVYLYPHVSSSIKSHCKRPENTVSTCMLSLVREQITTHRHHRNG